MIYVIFGASGSGKSTLIKCAFDEYGEESIHKKGTTRKKRSYDDIEIISFPDGLPEERFGEGKGYVYSQYGYEYGIERAQLDEAVANHHPHFVICNDLETIKRLRIDYKNHICVVYLRFDAPKEMILDIQKARGISDDEISRRVSRIEYLNEIFIHNSSFFDQVLSNKYGEDPEIGLWKQMKNIMASYENLRIIPSKSIIFEIVDYMQKVIRDNEKNEIQNGKIIEKDFAFVIMPMAETDDIYHVFYAICKAAQDAGYRAERADSIRKSSSIDEKVFENIKKAEIIIVDLSYERPNCYFELGYAKALGKEFIIIARKGTKIHFNAEHYDCIFFENEKQLVDELTRQLELIRKNKK